MSKYGSRRVWVVFGTGIGREYWVEVLGGRCRCFGVDVAVEGGRSDI